MYAYLRVKWNIARGFRYEIKENNEFEFTLSLKQTNIANKKAWQPAAVTVKKIYGLDGKSFGECECAEHIHTGFPCPHLCLLNYKGKIDNIEINNRWKKNRSQ